MHNIKPNLKSVIDNLKSSIPLKRKIYLFIKNFLLKLIRFKSCCGNPGEPGC